ncbi:TetR/AcrR family transcriptional regulator [Leucobacter weissii]|uniref:TetR/AcrR family transcriptional regulator n=1 Tax=Leucobacter weissii TaxID=1983706 RepID=A0A939MKH9_9MICO|nr:TetR/AcrR family transcriptional regulator [Leucobacter weissii]MBO1902658.1 TetR/AcrR family transcriptional regulator [Leucobacter weissii]
MTESVAPSARRQATRDRLLEAATEVFVEEGLQGASVEAICSRAGFTRGAFYSNFDSKEELFLVLLEREFARQSAELQDTTDELAPILRGQSCAIGPEQAAEYIAQILAPKGDTTAWYVLETEFCLLAMRDREMSAGYAEFLSRSHAAIVGPVESALAAAGRRFTLPAEHALAILGGEYERAIKITALSGAAAPGGVDELARRISEVLFAITEPI